MSEARDKDRDAAARKLIVELDYCTEQLVRMRAEEVRVTSQAAADVRAAQVAHARARLDVITFMTTTAEVPGE